MLRRASRSCRRPRSVVSIPSKTMRPEVTLHVRMMHLAKVVLPEPDSPTRPRVSPGSISRLTPSTARMMFCVLDRRPRELLRKSLVTSRTFRKGSIVLEGGFGLTCESHHPVRSSRSTRDSHRDVWVAVGANRFGTEGSHESTGDESSSHQGVQADQVAGRESI